MGKKHRNSFPDSRPIGPSLRALADSLPVPVLLADPAGLPLHANAGFRAQYGTPPEAGWLDLLGPSERPGAEALWLAAAAALAPKEAGLRLRGLAGPVRATCRVAPLRESGHLLGWSVVLTEAVEDRQAELRDAGARLAASESRLREFAALLTAETARRTEAEARLALAEERLAQISARRKEMEARERTAARILRAQVDAAPPMLWTAGPDGLSGFANEAWRDFTGAGPDEDWLSFVHPEDRTRVLGLWAHAVSRGEPFEAEHRLRHRDGGHRLVLTRARAAWDDSGVVLGWIGSSAVLPPGDPTTSPGPAPDRRDARQPIQDRPAPGAGAQPAGAPERPRPVALRTVASGAGAPPPPSGSPSTEGARPRLPGPPSVAPAEEGPASAAASRDPAGGGLLPSGGPEDEPEIDRLAGRLRSATLRRDLARWRAARGSAAERPLAGWEEAVEAPGQLVIEVDGSGTPVRLQVVRSPGETPLLKALATPPGGEGQGWRRCAASGCPAYDFAQVASGPQGVHSLERLLLPFSSDGSRTDRLLLLMDTGGPLVDDRPSCLAS